MRVLSFLIALFVCLPAYAQEEQAAAQPQPETPITKWMAAESAVVAGLDDQGKETYFILRNKYGLIRAIRIVKKDVGKAVQSCGQANPDMQDQMYKRYAAWTDSVDPILRTAESYLKQEIKLQTVVELGTFMDMLDLNDEAYDFQQASIEKEPVTTAEACKNLLISMDRTEEDMLRLMQAVLLPESLIRQEPRN